VLVGDKFNRIVSIPSSKGAIMQKSRRVLLVTSAILGLVASVGIASAAPLQGLDGAAAVLATPAAADAPHIEKADWHRHWHRWHRHGHHRHW
jgi:hypothetical protein